MDVRLQVGVCAALALFAAVQARQPDTRADKREAAPPKITLDAHGDPHFVDSPGEPIGEHAELLSRVERMLAAGRPTAELLADASFAVLRPYTKFRELIRTHAKSSKASLVPPGEPGVQLTVLGRVRDSEGKPVPDASVYAYQTSSRGWYAAEAPHVGGNSGDDKHARLFAYVRSEADGTFELATVRPGGYPRSTLPQHIHFWITSNSAKLGTEIVFHDDPRLTTHVLEEARKSGYVVVTTEKLGDGSERCRADFRLAPR